MAETMFGQDPALLQQQIQQEQQKQAFDLAQQDFGSSAAYGMGLGGGMLAQGLGQAAGYQDPRMADAMLDKQILQKSIEDAKTAGVDVNDPMAFGKVYMTNQMNAGRPQKAYAVAQQLGAMAKTTAETKKNEAEAAYKLHQAKQEVSPISKVNPGDFKPSSIAAFQQTGDYGKLELKDGSKPLIHEFGVPNNPNMKQTNISYDNGKSWQPLGGPVDLRSTASNVNVGVKAFNPVSDARKDFRMENKADIDSLKLIADAEKLVKGAGDNPFSAAALNQTMAGVFGDSQKAAAEIQALANTGALPQRISNSVVAFLGGNKTAATRADIAATIKAIKDNKVSTLKTSAKQYMGRTDLSAEDKKFITMDVLGKDEGKPSPKEMLSKSGKPMVSYDDGATWEYK